MIDFEKFALLYNACVRHRHLVRAARIFGEKSPELADRLPLGRSIEELEYVWEHWFAGARGPIPPQLEPGMTRPPPLKVKRRKRIRADRRNRRAPEGLLDEVEL